ncbi:MAG: PucR family transcriptional regulator ligand-binding domain-containing protein, partial [Herbiconiux sp.]|nr:PucR family transcriptional regulator ligand-binding domain-containing protein [Herbiconiux sp.]
MSVTVRDLVRHRPLGIGLLTSGFDDRPLNWSHASDLDDPSPFLEPGQLLLTTGRQFTAYGTAADYAAYVERLRGAGVVALGFGTEVLRDGTPAELVAACESAGLALVEVPYATPFIAVGRFIADRLAAEARERLEWALAAQEAISKAVLGSGGLAAAVRSASEALHGRVAVLDADGAVLEGGAPAWLRTRALELLRRGNRARDHGDEEGGVWLVQTLGRSGRLLGALAV